MRLPIPTSYPEGLPATATVTFDRVLAAGDSVTVNGTAAVFGTDFQSRNLNTADVAASFAAWVNGSTDGYGVGSTHVNSNPVGAVWAVYFGNRVTLIARVPGTAGNSLTLATSVSTKVTISGATFAGGTASTAFPTGVATSAKQDTQITAEQAIQTAVEKVIPATTASAVTPSDSTVLTSRAVWVGGAGDLSVRLSGATGTTVVFTAVPAGTLLPISVVRVMAATTATNINVLN